MDMTNRRPVPGPLSAATTVVGVIGDPVAHSLSPLLHNTAFAVMGLVILIGAIADSLLVRPRH